MTTSLYYKNTFKIISISLILAFQLNNLTDFKTGTYIYKGEAFNDVIVIRTESYQIESLGDSIFTYFDIKWIDSKGYFLIPNKVIFNSKTTFLPKDTIRVSILSILSDTSYRYQAVVNQDTTEHIMIKISDK